MENELEGRLRDAQADAAASKKQLNKWHGRALDAQQRAGPSDVVLKEVRLLARCLKCGRDDRGWKERVCCQLGVAVGQWESWAVASVLMETEGPANSAGGTGFFKGVPVKKP